MTRPAEFTQPAYIAQPGDVTPVDVPQPAELAPPTFPASSTPATPTTPPSEVPIPQVLYDAHGWWAQQEEAEREEASRSAQAGAGAGQGEAQVQAPVSETDPPEAAGGAETRPASRDDESADGRTATRPNPAIGSVPSPPDDDALAWAQEQSRR